MAKRRLYVLAVDQDGHAGFPLWLEGYGSREDAMRAINWQHWGGYNDRREFVIALPHHNRGVFVTEDERTLSSVNNAYVPQVYQKFLQETWS